MMNAIFSIKWRFMHAMRCVPIEPINLKRSRRGLRSILRQADTLALAADQIDPDGGAAAADAIEIVLEEQPRWDSAHDVTAQNHPLSKSSFCSSRACLGKQSLRFLISNRNQKRTVEFPHVGSKAMSGPICVHSPSGSARKRHSVLSFRDVCPEPVLVK
jgi:hypothetical protein